MSCRMLLSVRQTGCIMVMIAMKDRALLAMPDARKLLDLAD